MENECVREAVDDEQRMNVVLPTGSFWPSVRKRIVLGLSWEMREGMYGQKYKILLSIATAVDVTYESRLYAFL